MGHFTWSLPNLQSLYLGCFFSNPVFFEEMSIKSRCLLCSLNSYSYWSSYWWGPNFFYSEGGWRPMIVGRNSGRLWRPATFGISRDGGAGWGFPQMKVPRNAWFIMAKPYEHEWFKGTHISGDFQMGLEIVCFAKVWMVCHDLRYVEAYSHVR